MPCLMQGDLQCNKTSAHCIKANVIILGFARYTVMDMLQSLCPHRSLMHVSVHDLPVCVGLTFAESQCQVLIHCWFAHPVLGLYMKAPFAYTEVVLLQ